MRRRSIPYDAGGLILSPRLSCGWMLEVAWGVLRTRSLALVLGYMGLRVASGSSDWKCDLGADRPQTAHATRA